jgi:4-diphosphocytidyl-2-C-methyl-D-erythritol kinase
VDERAHAKLNLLLAVEPGVRPDGYHAVTTVMCALELADDVSVEEASAGSGVALCCEPDPLPAGSRPQDNLAWRAAEALARRVGRPADVSISIRKRVPSQAGLGGASSDAAAVLRALARLWGLEPADPALYEVAASLGADVPFFLDEVPTLLDGRGDVPRERFAPFVAPLVLAKPPAGVPTGAAYAALDRIAPPVPAGDTLISALRARDVAAVLHSCANNMEPAAREVAPEVGEVLLFLGSRPGALGAPLLCGSGSCTALFVEDAAVADRIAREARGRGWWAAATSTLAE